MSTPSTTRRELFRSCATNCRRRPGRSLASLVLLLTLVPATLAIAADSRPNQEFRQRASWKLPTVAAVRQQVLELLTAREIDAATRAQLETLWESAAAGGSDAAIVDANLLELVTSTLAALDPRARDLVSTCAQPRKKVVLPDVAWLAEEKFTPLERDNLRLLYGRWLAQEHLYEEAGEQFKDLKVDKVVDPAALLFYRAVVEHQALNRTAGLATIKLLLENEGAIPRRFTSVARLMQADLEPLKDESLDHIARRMEDIRRRLDLGRAGPKVREVEDGVIASLDKLIEEMEAQQQAAAAAAAAAGGGGNAQPSQPAPDSMPMELKGAGQVAKKNIGNSSGWGDLPPRARQEALQQIGKDFPAHYRDVIEQYFRKLASEDGQDQK